MKLPFAIHYKTKCCIKQGGLILSSNGIQPFMIHVGFHEVPIIESSRSLLDIKGKLIFHGTAYIGKGSRIVVAESGIVDLGEHFAISAYSFIYCYKSIKLGNNIQLSWNDLLMDSDSHAIYDEHGVRFNENKGIEIGDNVWVGCDCKILKGAVIPSNCVIGANSVVTSASIDANTLAIGSPAKSVKKISHWEI